MPVHLKGKKKIQTEDWNKNKNVVVTVATVSLEQTKVALLVKEKKKYKRNIEKKKKIVVAIVPFEQTKVALLPHWRFLYIN